MKHQSITRLLIAPLVTSALLYSAADAASYSSKDGMGTTNEPMADSSGTEGGSSLGGVATRGLPAIRQGAVEFGLSGYLDWTDDTSYATNLRYGRYVTDNWLLGASLGLSGVNSNVNFSGGLFAEYNFVSESKWVPFIGVGANWKRFDSGSLDADAIELAAEFGVKYFIRSNVAISGSISGTWASDTLPDSDNFGSRVNFGLRYVF